MKETLIIEYPDVLDLYTTGFYLTTKMETAIPIRRLNPTSLLKLGARIVTFYKRDDIHYLFKMLTPPP